VGSRATTHRVAETTSTPGAEITAIPEGQPPNITNWKLKTWTTVDNVTIASYFDDGYSDQLTAATKCESVGWKLGQLPTTSLFIGAQGLLSWTNGMKLRHT
jgi:hypothetical protein